MTIEQRVLSALESVGGGPLSKGQIVAAVGCGTGAGDRDLVRRAIRRMADKRQIIHLTVGVANFALPGNEVRASAECRRLMAAPTQSRDYLKRDIHRAEYLNWRTGLQMKGSSVTQWVVDSIRAGCDTSRKLAALCPISKAAWTAYMRQFVAGMVCRGYLTSEKASGGVIYRLASGEGAREPKTDETVTQKILELLKEGPATTGEIAACTGRVIKVVSPLLQSLESRGMVSSRPFSELVNIVDRERFVETRLWSRAARSDIRKAVAKAIAGT